MKSRYLVHPGFLSLQEVQDILQHAKHLEIGPECRDRIRLSRRYLEDAIRTSARPMYGINTGFGSLCDVRIENESLEDLQTNLVRSHACGTGAEVPAIIVKLILLFKIKSLSYGFSGVRMVLIERLLEMYNGGLLPVIYEQGSLGASGDLAPLAHMSLPLIGEGKVRIDGVSFPSSALLQSRDWQPLRLGAKEGLALLNGTQFSLSYASWSLIQARQLLSLANLCAAFSLEAFQCDLQPLDPKLQEIRPHKGQSLAARQIAAFLRGSDLEHRQKYSVQDPYSFRCSPVVHGASIQSYFHCKKIVETEINSVTDNPNIFYEEEEILSGGNFHAQPLALVMDYLAMALSEIGSISERRAYQMISGQRDLPAYLTPKPGLQSGMMISQYTAASIVSQNKQLCTPASVDSIVSSIGQEDHVSMAANAGTKLYRIVNNVYTILSIEFAISLQALQFREARLSDVMKDIADSYRRVVPPLENDRILSDDIKKTDHFLRQLDLSQVQVAIE